MHHLKWMTHADTLMEIQRNLHNDESSCDVLLTSDKGIFFRAHRFLLCFCSDYFKDMFRDVPAGQEVTVIIPDVRPSILKTILDFIYTGEACVSSTDMTDFFNTFNLLEIKSGINCERRTVPKTEAVQQYQEGLTIEPVDDIEIEIQQPNDTVEKSEETDGMQSEKELEYLEVYSSHEKFAQYTIEQSNNDYILTETTEPSFVLPVEKAENEITINPDEVQDVETMELEKNYKVQKPQKIYKEDVQGSPSRVAAFEAAVQEVLRLGVSLQKAATKYNISKTVLWRRVRKNSAYKAEREHPMLSSAIKMLEKGESLKSISQMIKIPISTLHRHKVRLLQEGRLPQHIQVKRRDANDNLKERLAEAISACGRGMSQNQAANLFSVPKSTLWRHLQKQSCTLKLEGDVKEEILPN